jgi:RNA ligase
MVAEGYILVQKHPTADIYIYNYSKSCSLEGKWNEATIQCRGIIVDKDYNILARPFEKFFNYEEIEDKSVIPGGAADAYEKIDGSLGIMYWLDDVPYIATRGSFSSDQALHATEVLHTKYREEIDVIKHLRYSHTFLFEIVYPENRIVVDYGDTDDIILLAIINNANPQNEIPISFYEKYFNTAKYYGRFDNYLNLRESIAGDNREGFVLRFDNGFRMKMKYEDYFRLHRLRTYLTKKHIFEFIETNSRDELNEMVDQFDEEIRMSVNKIVEEFDNRFSEIESEARSEYREFDTDKEAALYFNTCKWRPILFNMRKGKPYDPLIWRVIKGEIKEDTKEE